MSDESNAPKMGNGREDFEERRERRSERLRARAADRRGEAESRSERALTMAGIMNGQPVLVGHHSEGRHRRDLDRMQRNMGRAVEASREAERLESAAEACEGNTAISSDDPESLVRLKEKIAAMEAQREEIKRENRLARQGDAAIIAKLARNCGFTCDDPRRGHPKYVLTNLGGNIRRVKARIAELEARAGREPREREFGSEVTVRENPETNRVELDIGRRATREECRAIKGRGFKWSRTNEVWQRLANESAWSAGCCLAEQIGGAE